VKIHKGDEVQVLSGKHRGKTGEVIRAIPEQRKVVVSGVNISKRHQRPTRARYEIGKDGTKTRVCAKCGGKL